MMNIYIKGFTLAEVLITLVIIGVIAAITVPSLINKTNNKETVSRLKKAYSTLAQATNQIIFEEGKPKSADGGWASSSDKIYELYKKRLINSRECGVNTGCFGQGQYKNADNTTDSDFDNLTASNKLVLNDGTQVFFFNNTISPTCTYNYYGNDKICAQIYVDINGRKNPNVYGKDIFVFGIKQTGLYPMGCEDDSYCFSKGWTCACKVLKEGTINY